MKALEAKAAAAQTELDGAVEAARADAEKASQALKAAQAEVAAEAAKAAQPPKAAQDGVAAEAAKAATTPAAGLKFGKWTLESATWRDGGAAELTEASARSIAACLRTVKKSRAEVVITIAAGKIGRAEVKGESLKCVDELRGVATPDLGHDGEFTAIYKQ